MSQRSLNLINIRDEKSHAKELNFKSYKNGGQTGGGVKNRANPKEGVKTAENTYTGPCMEYPLVGLNPL